MKPIYLFATLGCLTVASVSSAQVERIWLTHKTNDPSKLVVNWTTKLPGDSRVRYGPTKEYGQEVTVPGSTTLHHVEIPLTKKEKVEAYVTEVIMHEIGHTLGLRHNFKGSLLPPTCVLSHATSRGGCVASSPGAAEYGSAVTRYDSVAMPTPGRMRRSTATRPATCRPAGHP